MIPSTTHVSLRTTHVSTSGHGGISEAGMIYADAGPRTLTRLTLSRFVIAEVLSPRPFFLFLTLPYFTFSLD